MAESLRQDANLQSVAVFPESVGVLLRALSAPWRGSSPSGPAKTSSINALSATVRVIGPRWSIVEFDRHCTGVGPPTPGWLHADDAAARGWCPDRAPLIATNGQVYVAIGNQEPHSRMMTQRPNDLAYGDCELVLGTPLCEPPDRQ